MLDPLPDDKTLDRTKLKQTADNILKCIENEKLVSYKVENIVRKEEIVCHKQFRLFSRCFHSYISFVRLNVALCGNGLRNTNAPAMAIFLKL